MLLTQCKQVKEVSSVNNGGPRCVLLIKVINWTKEVEIEVYSHQFIVILICMGHLLQETGRILWNS